MTSQHIARTHQHFTRQRRLNGLPNLRVDQTELVSKDSSHAHGTLYKWFDIPTGMKSGPFCSYWILLQTQRNILRYPEICVFFRYQNRETESTSEVPTSAPSRSNACTTSAHCWKMLQKWCKSPCEMVQCFNPHGVEALMKSQLALMESIRFVSPDMKFHEVPTAKQQACACTRIQVWATSANVTFLILIICMHFHTWFIFFDYENIMRSSQSPQLFYDVFLYVSAYPACALWPGCPVQWSPWNTSKGHRVNIRPSSYQLLYRSICQTKSTASPCYSVLPNVFLMPWCVFALYVVLDVALTLSNVFSLFPFHTYVMWTKFHRKHASSTTAAWPWRAAQCSGSASCLSLPLHHQNDWRSERWGKPI